ncbi:MAG: ABC transporter ATP-binding protein, partial [Thermoprotei archaeon]
SILSMSKSKRSEFHHNVQMIFQDPYEAINPRYSVFDTVAEGLKVQGVKNKEIVEERVHHALEYVRLSPPEMFARRKPFELSGGQLQRVAIARALVLDPKIILADEPVSMLDVSVRAEVLNTLLKAKTERDMGVVFITHDIALADYVSDSIAVMYLGKIVEYGDANEVVTKPLHPYTQAIIDAVPQIGKTFVERELIKGEISSAMNIPQGCRFRNRCPYAQRICEEREPELTLVEGSHYAACHFAGQVAPPTIAERV